MNHKQRLTKENGEKKKRNETNKVVPCWIYQIENPPSWSLSDRSLSSTPTLWKPACPTRITRITPAHLRHPRTTRIQPLDAWDSATACRCTTSIQDGIINTISSQSYLSPAGFLNIIARTRKIRLSASRYTASSTRVLLADRPDTFSAA
jgi:hypothetical protein